ncbi:deoxyuridine 5'-triphosphate nucleotidohydrolase-like [Rhinolophus ferrumequinum]|uniref:deoxyuridine 5'-triphosphate nucleotidohydrolase-like n=1 Tax=Rhinolophus ferrumequinum TaxID=59479 RepID=UPI00140F700A|nr:deoxyuridine 5'-triphosphate nucleotidohydrolase-like [Rhinolophus ferrumequinum]
MDLYNPECHTIPTRECLVIPLHIGIVRLSHHFGLLKNRSTLASQGVQVQGGAIDSDYQRELKVILQNDADQEWTCKKGDRIVQLLVIPYTMWPISEIDPPHLLTQRGVGVSDLPILFFILVPKFG